VYFASIHRAIAAPLAKPFVFVLALLPLAYWLSALWNDALGANPAEALLRGTGLWTLRMLCVLLLVSPLREAMGWAALARLRRMLGLFVFFYALVHFVAYVWLDQSGQWEDILGDVPKRPFILVGLLAFMLLIPLALTSFNAAMRWMGAARWRHLHRAVYVIGLLAILHFFWMRAGKRNFDQVALYAALIGALLAWRVGRRFIRRGARPGTSR
jgi:sulfoxide reductase heme-binding subunit YedZ